MQVADVLLRRLGPITVRWRGLTPQARAVLQLTPEQPEFDCVPAASEVLRSLLQAELRICEAEDAPGPQEAG